jgi:hypothetical protein
MTQRTLIVAGVAVIAALSAVSLATRTEETSATVSIDDGTRIQTAFAEYEDRLLSIGRALERERKERARLAAEIAELRQELGRLNERATVEVAVAAAEAEQEGDDPDVEQESAQGRRRGLDVDALVAVGFSPDTVRSYKERIDQIELERLYLRDLAAREGWLDTPRFREESRDLTRAVRENRAEFGEEFYDWMLYTSGHPNRVRVDEVMDGSAAADAGLVPGDVILRYGQQRIFSPAELREATADGTAGEATAVAVLRDGQETQIYVPRGPLGIRIDFTTEEPPPVG